MREFFKDSILSLCIVFVLLFVLYFFFYEINVVIDTFFGNTCEKNIYKDARVEQDMALIKTSRGNAFAFIIKDKNICSEILHKIPLEKYKRIEIYPGSLTDERTFRKKLRDFSFSIQNSSIIDHVVYEIEGSIDDKTIENICSGKKNELRFFF